MSSSELVQVEERPHGECHNRGTSDPRPEERRHKDEDHDGREDEREHRYYLPRARDASGRRRAALSADPRVATAAEIARLSGQVEGLGHEIRDLKNTAKDTLLQTRTTNGRVTKAEQEILEIKIRGEERERAEQQLLDERRAAEAKAEKARARRDRWLIAMATVTTGSALTALATLAFRIWG